MARGNRTMGFLRRNFRECTPKVKTATYTTLVRPTLEYASAVWDPYKQKDAQLLENVQRRAARYVNNNYKDRSPGCVTSMVKNLKWTSLEHRRRHIRLGMLYKINKGLVDINPANFFHSFFPRTVSEWNHLPTSISSSPSLESFQSRLGRSLHKL